MSIPLTLCMHLFSLPYTASLAINSISSTMRIASSLFLMVTSVACLSNYTIGVFLSAVDPLSSSQLMHKAGSLCWFACML